MSIRVPQPKPVKVTAALIGVSATLLIVTADAIGCLAALPADAGQNPDHQGDGQHRRRGGQRDHAAPACAAPSPLDLLQQRVEHLGAHRRCFRRRIVERFHFLGGQLRQQRGDAAQFGDGRAASWAGSEMRFELAPFSSRQ